MTWMRMSSACRRTAAPHPRIMARLALRDMLTPTIPQAQEPVCRLDLSLPQTEKRLQKEEEEGKARLRVKLELRSNHQARFWSQVRTKTAWMMTT
mmetsp:Transcript_24508/g.56708  ORF Transcript_24508/g.56708 Transcript_24508/m.56708 type:complete len:95 (-) Transcript_24508:220-504(-)